MSTSSKFADDLSRRLTHGLTGLLRRFEYEYQELTDGQFGRTDSFPEVIAAQQLYERLKIQ